MKNDYANKPYTAKSGVLFQREFLDAPDADDWQFGEAVRAVLREAGHDADAHERTNSELFRLVTRSMRVASYALLRVVRTSDALNDAQRETVYEACRVVAATVAPD